MGFYELRQKCDLLGKVVEELLLFFDVDDGQLIDIRVAVLLRVENRKRGPANFGNFYIVKHLPSDSINFFKLKTPSFYP